MSIPFERMSREEWEAIPVPAKAQPASRWDAALDELESTEEPIWIAVTDEKQARGYRIGLARRAASRNMKLEFRLHDGRLAVHKSGEVTEKVSPSQSEATPRRRGRKSKQESQGEA